LENDTKFSRAELWILDLCNFESVKRFADKATAELERIDLLIENAAMATYKYEATPEGWEKT
jgi:NAD(P)-dependent dehydrogenase (short-subunit alcohol dehydrogenase family)